MLEKSHIKLKKELGLIQATFAGLGIILGAGIYTLLGKSVGVAGNSAWISFFIAAAVASFTGLSYAELSSMYPEDAGEEEYSEKAFSKRIGFLVAWLVIFSGVVSAATVAIGFGGYLSGVLSNFISLPVLIGAIFCIVLFSFLNFWGIKESSEFNIIGTLIEGGGLILIVILGLNYFGKVNYLSMPHGFSGVVSGAALIFFAYIGFQSIVKLSEETEHAKKIIPKALILSIIISTIMYVLVALASVSIFGWQALAQSKAPLAAVAAAVLGNKAFLVLGVIAIFSTANTVLMSLVVTSRMLYGIGKRFKRIDFLSWVSKRRRTPWLAILICMVLAVVFTLIGDIKIVAELTNFTVFTTFLIVNASLLILRKREPERKRPFKSPFNVKWLNIPALLGIFTTTALLAYLSSDWKVYAGGIVLVLAGVVIYEIIT